MSKTSVYRHFDKDGRLLYVGISHDAFRRLGQHSNKDWYADIFRMDVRFYDSAEQALFVEATAIRDEKPLYNSRRPKPVHPDYVVKKKKELMSHRNWVSLQNDEGPKLMVYTILAGDQDVHSRLNEIASSIEIGRGLVQADIDKRGREFSWLMKLAHHPGMRILSDRPDAFSDEHMALLARREIDVEFVERLG